jgi:hypothetical protein
MKYTILHRHVVIPLALPKFGLCTRRVRGKSLYLGAACTAITNIGCLGLKGSPEEFSYNPHKDLALTSS